MDEQESKIPHAGKGHRGTRHRSRKHRSHAKSKKPSFKRLRKWIKNNPLKTIALLSIGVIIFLTVLFYSYNAEMLTATEITPPDRSPVKGILLPLILVSESSPVQIRIGEITSSISLEELRLGYIISPETLVNCKTEKATEDRTKFTISLVEDRVYINAEFRDLLTDDIAAAINKKNWTALIKNALGFYSDDNSFRVSDSQGNIIFNMQFNQPDTLSVEGYFSGKECVYVLGNNTIYSDHKVGNYLEKALNEIKKLK